MTDNIKRLSSAANTSIQRGILQFVYLLCTLEDGPKYMGTQSAAAYLCNTTGSAVCGNRGYDWVVQTKCLQVIDLPFIGRKTSLNSDLEANPSKRWLALCLFAVAFPYLLSPTTKLCKNVMFLICTWCRSDQKWLTFNWQSQRGSALQLLNFKDVCVSLTVSHPADGSSFDQHALAVPVQVVL